jgi:HSP20 family protein
MSYTFYSNHPIFDLFGSFVEPTDEPRTFGGRCEGGPCGPGERGRGRGPHRGGFRHHGPHGGFFPGHHHRPHDRSGEREDTPAEPDVYNPPADVYSTDTEYKVYISLPSADKETIELTYDPNTRELAVSGTLVRPADFANLDEEALKNVLIQSERKVGKFERKLKIPRDDTERIRFEEAVAKFDNGVLELSLPKVEKEGPKTIVID